MGSLVGAGARGSRHRRGGQDSVTLIRYLVREEEGNEILGFLPKIPDDIGLPPETLRSLCVVLGIDPTDFGLP